MFLPRDGARLLRLPPRMWAYSVSASIAPNALFRAYFLFHQYDAKLLPVQSHAGEYSGWKQEADTKYRYVSQTVNAQTHGDKVTVRARLTGEFSGSPVELDHIFKPLNDKIASLEIRP